LPLLWVEYFEATVWIWLGRIIIHLGQAQFPPNCGIVRVMKVYVKNIVFADWHVSMCQYCLLVASKYCCEIHWKPFDDG
jgi:hypothetical protein